MGEIKYVKVPPDVKIVVPLDKLDYIFNEEKKIVIIKRRPLVTTKYACGARHWFSIIGPFVRGGFKVRRAGNEEYVRTLPFGKIRVVRKGKGDEWEVVTEGYHVFIRSEKSDTDIRPAKLDEIPDISDIYVVTSHTNSIESRTCHGHLKIEPISGNIYSVCAETSCAVDSGAGCTLIVKNNSVYRIRYGRGEYRGTCWEEVTYKKVSIVAEPGDEYVRLNISIENIPEELVHPPGDDETA